MALLVWVLSPTSDCRHPILVRHKLISPLCFCSASFAGRSFWNEFYSISLLLKACQSTFESITPTTSEEWWWLTSRAQVRGRGQRKRNCTLQASFVLCRLFDSFISCQAQRERANTRCPFGQWSLSFMLALVSMCVCGHLVVLSRVKAS